MSEPIFVTSEASITNGKKPWYMWELEKQKKELTDLKAQFAEYVLAERKWMESNDSFCSVDMRKQYRVEASELREKAIKTLGL